MTTEIKLTQLSSPYSVTPLPEKEVVEVKGFAVHVGTFNNITIEKEELEKAAKSLIGRPLLKNHDNDVEVVSGKIIDTECRVDPDNGEYGLEYTAEVDSQEEDLIRKMKMEFVGSVSVGFASEHICSICGESIFSCPHWFWDEGFKILAKDIRFLELSVVAVPADENATIKINFANAEDEFMFNDLIKLKKERRQKMSDNFESKYNDIVEKFNNYKMEKVDEINSIKEEFKATKEQLEADKADKVEEVISLKNEVETLKEENETLKVTVSEYKESFNKIEEERLSSLREKVAELNAEVNGGYTEEEIASLEETTLKRIAESFENISKHMVKLHKPIPSKTNPIGESSNQYRQEADSDVKLSESLTTSLRNIRGF